jgi:hypothetical protein
MSSDVVPDVSALAINVTIPEGLRWTDTRRGEEFTLTTLNSMIVARRGQLLPLPGHDHGPGPVLAGNVVPAGTTCQPGLTVPGLAPGIA